MNPMSTPRYADQVLFSALTYFSLSHRACQEGVASQERINRMELELRELEL